MTNRRWRGFLAAFLMAGLVGLALASSAQALVYFVNDPESDKDSVGPLGRAGLSSGEIQQTFKPGFPLPSADQAQFVGNPRVVESDGEYLYSFHRGDGGSQFLQRVAVNGAEPEVLYNLPLASAAGAVDDIEVGGGMIYVTYAAYLGNGFLYYANRLRADGSGLDDSWVPALNGTASCDDDGGFCDLDSELTIDEQSGSAYWTIFQLGDEFLELHTRLMRIPLDEDGQLSITRVSEARWHGEGESLGEPVAGDGHLYWTTEYSTGGDEPSSTYLSHARTSNHAPDHQFVEGDFEPIGVLDGDLYADGSIVHPDGQVEQTNSLPDDTVGATVDALEGFPPFQPCVDARQTTADAEAELERLEGELETAEKRVRAAKKKLANATSKAEREKAAAKLRKAKKAAKAVAKDVESAESRVKQFRDQEALRCNGVEVR